MRENTNTKEETKTTIETGREKPAPVSIDGEGDGAIVLSCADTSHADNNMTAAATTKKALEMLMCAI